MRRQVGLTLEELSNGLEPLLCAENFRTLTITEVNPDHAPDEESSFKALITFLFRAFTT